MPSEHESGLSPTPDSWIYNYVYCRSRQNTDGPTTRLKWTTSCTKSYNQNNIHHRVKKGPSTIRYAHTRVGVLLNFRHHPQNRDRVAFNCAMYLARKKMEVLPGGYPACPRG